MKYIRQFLIILLISFLGEVFKDTLPFPIPAAIYGLLLLLSALLTGLLKVDMVKETAAFLIEIMPLMFIPAAVGLTNSFAILRPIFVPVAVITIISTILVMGISGRITQFLIRMRGKRKVK